MKFKNLNLKELYKTTPIHLAHYNYNGSCTCCVAQSDFPKELWRNQTLQSFNDKNFNFLLFNIAPNVAPFDDVPLPKETDDICVYYPDWSNNKAYYDVMIRYGGSFFNKANLDKTLEKLQLLLGSSYRIYSPNDTRYCAALVHCYDFKRIERYDKDSDYTLIRTSEEQANKE